MAVRELFKNVKDDKNLKLLQKAVVKLQRSESLSKQGALQQERLATRSQNKILCCYVYYNVKFIDFQLIKA